MTSKWRNYQKQWQSLDLREIKQNIYHSKGMDESYPKMCFLLNLSHCIKRHGHFCQILALLRFRLTRYGHVTWPKMQISKTFYFFLILHSISGKVTKFLVEKLSTSEVVSKKPHEGLETPPPPPSAFREQGKTFSVPKWDLRWSETKKLKISIPDKIFFLYLIIIKLCTLRDEPFNIYREGYQIMTKKLFAGSKSWKKIVCK